jgi:hypothetical protein
MLWSAIEEAKKYTALGNKMGLRLSLHSSGVTQLVHLSLYTER